MVLRAADAHGTLAEGSLPMYGYCMERMLARSSQISLNFWRQMPGVKLNMPSVRERLDGNVSERDDS